MRGEDKVRCINCKKVVDEVCGGEYCRKCHVSLTFEDCIGNVSVNALRARYGLDPVR